METSVISPNKSQDRIWKSIRKGKCYEWLCKILIHDSSHRFLYPILSKRSPSVSTLGTNVNRVNVTTENAIRSRISTLTFFDRIGHVSWKRNTKRNANATNRNRKSENQFWLRIDHCLPTNESFHFICTPSIRIPFFIQLRVYLCSLPLYTRCAGYQSRERLDLVANKETNRRVFEVYNPVKKRITSIQTRKISKGVGPAQARDIHSNNTVHEQRSREREVDLWLRTS